VFLPAARRLLASQRRTALILCLLFEELRQLSRMRSGLQLAERHCDVDCACRGGKAEVQLSQMLPHRRKQCQNRPNSAASQLLVSQTVLLAVAHCWTLCQQKSCMICWQGCGACHQRRRVGMLSYQIAKSVPPFGSKMQASCQSQCMRLHYYERQAGCLPLVDDR
jgi:hypothetical protein